MGTKQLIVFACGTEEYGIDIELVGSIENMLKISAVPNSSKFIEGLVNLRGNVHTIFNLRKRFGIPSLEFNENNRIIMVKESGSLAGIIVDEVREIIKVDDDNIESVPENTKDLKYNFASGIVRVNGRSVMLLDTEKVFTLLHQ